MGMFKDFRLTTHHHPLADAYHVIVHGPGHPSEEIGVVPREDALMAPGLMSGRLPASKFFWRLMNRQPTWLLEARGAIVRGPLVPETDANGSPA